MTDMEKVINGLEDCLSASCRGFKPGIYCPFQDDVWDLIRDAVALLKAQEPRVMTLEEVRTIPYGYVLIETDKADSLRWVDALLFSRNTNFSFDFITLEGRARLLGSEYGREWRCWTSRPDEKRRAETPWES